MEELSEEIFVETWGTVDEIPRKNIDEFKGKLPNKSSNKILFGLFGGIARAICERI